MEGWGVEGGMPAEGQRQLSSKGMQKARNVK